MVICLGFSMENMVFARGIHYPPIFSLSAWNISLGCLSSAHINQISISIQNAVPSEYVTWLLQMTFFFFRCDIQSINIFSQQLLSFGGLSGLDTNPAKSSIYFGGVEESIKQSILNHTGF